MAITDAKLDFWIKNGLNVLFSGRHGVGKTAVIMEAFNRNKLNWKYFSASTMDPWVDFIGVPKAAKDEKGSFLDLVLPREFRDDEIEAIFLDEYNRAPKKVRNAVMELIQFGSINGRKFNKLKIVWVAVNPEDDDDLEYDVEPLDPAQRDRFHIQCDIPYRCSKAYFNKKFGSSVSKAAIEWWESLPAAAQRMVSPRRLDYALDIHKLKGDIRDVLDQSTGVSKLLTYLETGPVKESLEKFMSGNLLDEAKKWLANENSYAAAAEIIGNKKKYFEFFLPLLGDEKIALMLHSYPKNVRLALTMASNSENVLSVLRAIHDADKDRKVVNAIKRELRYKRDFQILIKHGDARKRAANPDKFYQKGPELKDDTFESLLARWKNSFGKANYTHERDAILTDMLDKVPPKMSSKNSLKALKLLDGLFERSQVGRLAGNPKIMGLVNHIITEACVGLQTSYEGLKKSQGREFYHLRNKILSHSMIYNRYAQPTIEEVRAIVGIRGDKLVSAEIKEVKVTKGAKDGDKARRSRITAKSL